MIMSKLIRDLESIFNQNFERNLYFFFVTCGSFYSLFFNMRLPTMNF